MLEFVEQLSRLGLLSDAGERERERGSPCFRSATRRPPAPTAQALPGGPLNLFFDVLVSMVGWLLHPLWLIPLLLVMLPTAVTIVVLDWNLYGIQFGHWLSWHWLPEILLLVFTGRLFLMTLPCELAHCIVCRRFGGHIRKFGIRLWHGIIPQFHSEIGESLPFLGSRGCWTILSIDTWTLLLICTSGVIFWRLTQNNSVLGPFWMVLFWNCFENFLIHWIPFLGGNCYYLLCYAVGDPKLQEAPWPRHTPG